MRREERNEFNSIKRSLRRFAPGPGTVLTIRTDGGSEYKKALHEHYTGLGFHPTAITTDPRRFDSRERIVYVHGLTFRTDDGEHPWTEVFTKDELASFERALG